MGINSVDMDLALSSETYAAQVIRSGKCEPDERLKIAIKWGDDKIALWESVDSTQYRISDDDWNESKDAGKNAAKEATGHDGSKQSWVRVSGDAAGALANGAMAIAGKSIGQNVLLGKNCNGFVGKTLDNWFLQDGPNSEIKNKITGKTSQSGGKDLSDIATVIIGSAAAANYHFNKPNEDQHEAAMILYKDGEGLLVDGQDSLAEAQDQMEKATEKTTELAEDAQTINDEANDNIENDKTNFDFYSKQYEFIKAKAQSREKLTPEEKQILAKIAPLMEEAKTNIEGTQENASKGLSENYEKIQGFEGEYDEGAETIAEVQGLTDFAENFDSATRTMATIESISQGITATTTGAAAARLATKGGLTLGWTLAFSAMGAIAATRLGFASYEQGQWAGEIGQEVHFREATQDLGEATQGVYDTELDNFAGNMDIIDDMKIEVPTDMDMPDEVVDTGDDNDDPLAGGSGNLENDPEYTSVMGNGADYSDILTGKLKRGKDDKLVTDANGKVVLIRSYADAIKTVTGDTKGDGYPTTKIPEILAKLLGNPFTVSMINTVRNGGTLDSSYDTKFNYTKSGEEAGASGVNDNTATATQKAKDVIDFYWPIFEKAAQGWVLG